jgi:hypothetical protein
LNAWGIKGNQIKTKLITVVVIVVIMIIYLIFWCFVCTLTTPQSLLYVEERKREIVIDQCRFPWKQPQQEMDGWMDR